MSTPIIKPATLLMKESIQKAIENQKEEREKLNNREQREKEQHEMMKIHCLGNLLKDITEELEKIILKHPTEPHLWFFELILDKDDIKQELNTLQYKRDYLLHDRYTIDTEIRRYNNRLKYIDNDELAKNLEVYGYSLVKLENKYRLFGCIPYGTKITYRVVMK